jgi:predicted ferric reductase
MSRTRTAMIWTTLAVALVVPVAAAATSPLLAWRQPIYIAAGFAGIVAFALLLAQPLLISGYLRGLSGRRNRQVHRFIGIAVVALVAAHVLGLWITSPPDVIDALLFAAPTQFSIWGAICMWAVLITAIVAALRRKLRIKPETWRFFHSTLALIIVISSVLHAVPIEGTMEFLSKAGLSVLILLATLKVVADIYIGGVGKRRCSCILKRFNSID